MNVDDCWNRFVLTGSIQDYINYKELEEQQMQTELYIDRQQAQPSVQKGNICKLQQTPLF